MLCTRPGITLSSNNEFSALRLGGGLAQGITPKTQTRVIFIVLGTQKTSAVLGRSAGN
jgi:hypothetical protein